MDLDHLLVWTVGLSVVLAAGALVFRQGFQFPGWLAVCAGILAVLGAGVLLWPDRAGRVAALPWALFFLVPGLGARLLVALMARRATGAASLLAHLLAILHPFDGWREQPAYLRALTALAEGRTDEARQRLARLAEREGPIGWDARAHLHRLDGGWEALLGWIDRHPRRDRLLRDGGLALGRLRALGETGDLEGLADAYEALLEGPGADSESAAGPVGALFAAAFTGRTEAVDALVTAGRLPGFSPEVLRFWRATALQASGEAEAARPLLEALTEADDASVRLASRRRLTAPLPLAPALDPARAARLSARIDQALRPVPTLRRAPAAGPALATWSLLTLIGGVYVLQIPGGTTDIDNLIRMGALLLPPALLEGQWWRLLTANLLHYGGLHLFVNLAALWYFGRHLEAALGRVRFVLLFAVSGPLALSIVTGLSALAGPEPRIVVGASAAVMAVVGATGVHLFRSWRKDRSPAQRRDLVGLAIVLAAQVAFDLSTPQVGFAGHAAGLVCGVVLGVVLLATRGNPAGDGK